MDSSERNDSLPDFVLSALEDLNHELLDIQEMIAALALLAEDIPGCLESAIEEAVH